MAPHRPIVAPAFAGLAMLLLLGACVSSAGPTTTPEQRMTIWQDRCEGYGFERATTAFAGCVQKELLAYRQRVATVLSGSGGGGGYSGPTVCNLIGRTVICN